MFILLFNYIMLLIENILLFIKLVIALSLISFYFWILKLCTPNLLNWFLLIYGDHHQLLHQMVPSIILFFFIPFTITHGCILFILDLKLCLSVYNSNYMLKNKQKMFQNLFNLIMLRIFFSLTPYLSANGINYHLIFPHRHEQNNSIKRKHIHIIDTGLSLLVGSSLSVNFWGEAFSVVVHIINNLLVF